MWNYKIGPFKTATNTFNSLGQIKNFNEVTFTKYVNLDS